MKRVVLVFILVLSSLKLTYSEENDIARIDSAYISVIKTGNVDSMYSFVKCYKSKLIGALAACRLILKEIQNGKELDAIVQRLTENEIHLISRKEYRNATTIYFPGFNLRTIVDNDYRFHNNRDPIVELLDESEKHYIKFDFGALHISACNNFFKVTSDGILYFAADSAALNLIRSMNLHAIFKDFCAQMGYKSPSKAVKKLFKKERYSSDKLLVLFFDVNKTINNYLLADTTHFDIYSDIYNGIIYIDSQQHDRKKIVRAFTRLLSPTFFIGKNFQNITTDHNWFEKGFGSWASFCYSELGTLLPEQNSFLYKNLTDFINQNRAIAKGIFVSNNIDRIKLKEINEEINTAKWRRTAYSTIESYMLSLSLTSFIAERFGPKNLIEIIKRISHSRPELTELMMRSVIKWDYRDLEQNWNKWVMKSEHVIDSFIDSDGF